MYPLLLFGYPQIWLKAGSYRMSVLLNAMQDLFSIFKALPRPEQTEGTQNFTATHINGTSHRVGKDAFGWPVLLLAASSSKGGSQVHLEHLDVQHSLRCRVTNDQKTEEGLYTVIRCTEANDELAEYFLRTIDPILRTLGPSPTFAEILRAITHLVELFRALTQ